MGIHFFIFLFFLSRYIRYMYYYYYYYDLYLAFFMQFVVETIARLTLEPERQAALLQRGEFRHRLVLVLGTLIRHLHARGDEERASGLAARLQHMLGVHGQWRRREHAVTLYR